MNTLKRLKKGVTVPQAESSSGWERAKERLLVVAAPLLLLLHSAVGAQLLILHKCPQCGDQLEA